MSVTPVAVVAVAGLACVFDLRCKRIPNVLTFGAAVVAFGFGLLTQGVWGLWTAIAGWGVGCAVFLPWFLLGGMGAGDVKLLAGLGAWLGPEGALWAGLYAGLAGGPLALIVSAARGYLKQSFVNLWCLLTFWRISGVQPMAGLTLRTAASPRLPYALPIAVGAVVTLWLR
jgi:prepilin peptidase CpaA